MNFCTWEGTESLGRRRLLLRMAFALEAGERRYADRVLVQATRWLRRRKGGDPVVRQAREELRRGFLPVRQAQGRHGRGFPTRESKGIGTE